MLVEVKLCPSKLALSCVNQASDAIADTCNNIKCQSYSFNIPESVLEISPAKHYLEGGYHIIDKAQHSQLNNWTYAHIIQLDWEVVLQLRRLLKIASRALHHQNINAYICVDT